MKKILKILIIILLLTIILGSTFCFIDTTRVSKGQAPIFCYDASGGSVILYWGLGYTISGAYDDIPGGLEHAKIYTWLGWLLKEAI